MNDTASKTDNEESEIPVTEATAESTDTAAAANVEPTEESATDPKAIEEPDVPSLEEKLQAALADVAAAKDAQLRALADLENFRRRTVREKEELRAFAASRIVEDLMPVMDNLGLAVIAAKADNAELKSLVEGVEMVGNQFKSALNNHGLKEVNPNGVAFDPNLHEALSQQPSDDVEEGHVLQVVRIGYELNGRLLRPASVIVSGGPAAEEKEA